MKRMRTFLCVVAAAMVCAAGALAVDDPATPPSTDWAMNGTIIEACSCPMFCQCYFSPEPAALHDHGSGKQKHFCRANNAFQVNHGHYGATKLDGAKFWAAMDLGDDFRDGEMEWAIVTFDPAVTKEQREGIATILGRLYPVKWKSFTVAPDAAIEWNANKDLAVAKLNGGKNAEVVLKRFPGNTNDPVVIENLKYWGAPRNDGFVLMPNEVEAYRIGDKAFEYKGTNGFMITFDIKSSDFPVTN
jgi:hypothetical protein